MAMTHTAIYDAVNSIDDTHFPYHVNLNVPSTTSREAAAAQAAHDVLVNVFPAQQATLATALNNSLSGIPAGPAKTDGIALGSSVAGSIIALRANDHSGDTTPYTPGTLPGQWRPTPPGFAPALLPNWATVTPWTMTSGSQFRDPVGPPALSSAAYAAELNEVKAIGAVNSATRTADQTNIARFWASGGGTSQPTGHFNKIAQTVAAAEGNTLSENARMFALVNLAEADAADRLVGQQVPLQLLAAGHRDSVGRPGRQRRHRGRSQLATAPHHAAVSQPHFRPLHGRRRGG